MRIYLIAVGKPTQEYSALIREYEQRLPKYCTFEAREVKDDKELLKVNMKGTVVALDRNGKQMTSEGLAEWMSKQQDVTFVIGGPEGLPSIRTDLKISFSPLTFPHQLARLMITEQIYRAFTILKKEKYHK
ncbi:23S rRNA (pseudouridine(1915)-N(3))-methyltransferase RlmH [Candidatus Woesearchaeota archaeon]|nr:hypothetical protein [uncultured archaeon]AQS33862.1 hypothetical protein [uncultured archaeon]MBS3124892.1 23S rRNA (pseudouridine(1915)-N(3))-methyltransferase RlmH [Candidatus Woesearchaeota archaeon]